MTSTSEPTVSRSGSNTAPASRRRVDPTQSRVSLSQVKALVVPEDSSLIQSVSCPGAMEVTFPWIQRAKGDRTNPTFRNKTKNKKFARPTFVVRTEPIQVVFAFNKRAQCARFHKSCLLGAGHFACRTAPYTPILSRFLSWIFGATPRRAELRLSYCFALASCQRIASRKSSVALPSFIFSFMRAQ
jgi:hypothetical protein